MTRGRRDVTLPSVRQGFTLTELMISIVLFGLVMATGIQILARQQRFHRGANATIDMRGTLRHAAQVLPADLRSIWPAGGDISSWSRSSIGFRAFRASSIICQRPAASTIVLPPTTLARSNALSAWLQPPEAGDSILVYDENLGIGNDDDLWRPYEITAVTPVAGTCPTTSGFTEAGDITEPAYTVTLSGTLPSTVLDGAPVRVFRSTTYALYQAADRRWYLGVSDCVPGRAPVCSEMQPVSGPYRPLSINTAISGLTFWYFDDVGTPLDPAVDDPTRIARMEVVVRGETQTPFSTTSATGTHRDSLSFTVGLRNR